MSEYSATARSEGRRAGRPVGSNYEHSDAPLYPKMTELLVNREVPTVPAAAKRVAPQAFGYGYVQPKSIIKRLSIGWRRGNSTGNL